MEHSIKRFIIKDTKTIFISQRNLWPLFQHNPNYSFINGAIWKKEAPLCVEHKCVMKCCKITLCGV